MVDKKSTIVKKAVMLRVLPLMLTFVGSLFVLSVFRPYTSWIDPAHAFYGLIFIYSGIVFVFETIMATPDAMDKVKGGVMGAVAMAVSAGLSFLFAVLIILNQYDITHDTGILNILVSVGMIWIMVMFIVQAKEELFHYRRFKARVIAQYFS